MWNWFRGLKWFLPVLVFAGLLGGCATQMPVSEGLVFTDPRDYQGAHTFLGDDISGEMLEGISHIIPLGSFKRATIEKFGNNTFNTLDESFLSTLSLPSFAVFYRNRIAFGSTIPLPGFWQIDGTARLLDQYYLTVNKKILLKNTEIILQRRLWYVNNGGLSVGTFYRYDPFQLKQESGDQKSQRFYISWFGVRSTAQTPGNTFHLRGFINAGYVPQLKAPLVTVGISVALRAGSKHNKSRKSFPLLQQIL